MKKLCNTCPMNLRRIDGGVRSERRVLSICAAACLLLAAINGLPETALAIEPDDGTDGAAGVAGFEDRKAFVAVPDGSSALLLLGAVLVPLGLMRARRRLSSNT
jgi:hypothetical protein